MSDSIINFLKKQGDIFSSAKYFGGIDKLRELAKNNDEFKTYIEDNSKGWFSFRANGKNYKFDFEEPRLKGNYITESGLLNPSELNNFRGDQLSNLEIFTISGAKVASYLVSNESQLDLNLPSGIYLVKITSDTLSTTKKLIIN